MTTSRFSAALAVMLVSGASALAQQPPGPGATLGRLGCSSAGQIARFSGSAWVCSQDLTTLQNQNLDTRLSTLENQNLDSRLDTLEGQDLNSRLSGVESMLFAVGPGANFAGENLTSSVLANEDLRGANFAGAVLTGADLTGARLQGANLATAVLNNTQLGGANFDGANLVGASLANTTVTAGTSFRGANLTGITFDATDFNVNGGVPSEFSFATMPDANFRNVARFEGGRFVGADLSRAQFANLSMTGSTTDFRDADLSQADFSGATVGRSDVPNLFDFLGADMSGANFVGSTWINVRCPDGTNSDTAGQTCEFNNTPF